MLRGCLQPNGIKKPIYAAFFLWPRKKKDIISDVQKALKKVDTQIGIHWNSKEELFR